MQPDPLSPYPKCSGCSQPFTNEAEWADRHTPHALDCPGDNCVCDLNFHPDCCNDCGNTVLLSNEAYAVLAGLTAPTSDVNHDGILTSDRIWAEIREAFPTQVFWDFVKAVPNAYEPDFGR